MQARQAPSLDPPSHGQGPGQDHDAAGGPRSTGRPRVGRSGPRSRSGCVICKQRRVRCDEVHPVCGSCKRLELDCQYRPSLQRWRKSTTGSAAATLHASETIPASSPNHARPEESRYGSLANPAADAGIKLLGTPGRGQKSQQHAPDASWSIAGLGFLSRSGCATPNQYNAISWDPLRRLDFNDLLSDLNTSWAGEFSCVLPDGGDSSPASSPLQDSTGDMQALLSAQDVSSGRGTVLQPSALPVFENVDVEGQARPAYPGGHLHRRDTTDSFTSSRPMDLRKRRDSDIDNSAHLIPLFRKIVQPPAAILIGGFERWRRLQHYLCRLSDQSRIVKVALLCVVELLMIEETAKEQGQDRDGCMRRILERHGTACAEIGAKLSKHSATELKSKTREYLLAAIFLLAWFEVIRDQDTHPSLFPRGLADAVLAMDNNWNRYSQQLLSWLNTLDSKATHLGGEHLLSPESLRVVSHYPTQITSSLDHGDGAKAKDFEDSDLSLSDMTPGESHHSPDAIDTHHPSLRLGQVKQVLLHTILQPALEWYLTSQSYCRRISAHDRHHRKRLTSDDEYEVITACKELEAKLLELWEYRPAVISVAAEQLMTVVSPDIATRLEEIFSVYLASFWILFVYLHRVSWWNFPHSTITRQALAEVWQNMQRAYGEEVNGPLRRVIHPSLLWPLFLFGSECPEPSRRAWAIEQLEALGEAKPVLQNESGADESLPPFRLSSGATRNAKRAAVLLRELIKEQDARQARVDDRDLSMKLFGCYFSIV